jgi:UDP-2-acetamido-2,6-beta-L-arabino-hexul-4-ose reductase
MKRIGITGQSGFIGTHLYHFLSSQKDICCIPFKDEYFENESAFDFFTSRCDVIIHLAFFHRDPDPEKIYNTNSLLTKRLLDSCNRTDRCRHIIFTSSIQEINDTAYGRSKKDCRLLIETWARVMGKRATIFILPNIFGPCAKPFHTSFIATFSYQLWHKEEPRVLEDRAVSLVFIYDLLHYFYEKIMQNNGCETLSIPVSRIIKVSEVLYLLKQYQDILETNREFDFQDEFYWNLFKTFCSYG